MLALWVIANVALFVSAMLPHRGNHGGAAYRSDGLQLWEVPRASAQDVEKYLASALLVRGASLFDARDYPGSRAAAQRLLERVPDSHFARIMVSANASTMGDHATAFSVLAPLLSSLDTLDAPSHSWRIPACLLTATRVRWC